MKDILIPVSPGELLDKITILRIKAERLASPEKVANVRHELGLLEKIWQSAIPETSDILRKEHLLTSVNEDIWEAEEGIRKCEAVRSFGTAFIGYARLIYQFNDERAAIKKRINAVLGSALIEEKSHTTLEGK